MPDRIKEILNRILEWWKKFSTKQKTLVISILAVVIIALGILVAVTSQPTMVQLIVCEDTAQASEVRDLLTGDGITPEISSDGLTFKVNAKDESAANILLGSNNIPTTGYTLEDALSGGFSTSESDKSKTYQLYLEERFKTFLESLENVESASVRLSIPADDGTLISRQEDSYAGVILQLSSEMDEEQAAGIAQFMATGLGNNSTDSILIMDNNSNVLFSGGDSSSVAGLTSSQLSNQVKTETKVKKEVKDVILGTNVYDNVEVGLNLVLDFDSTKVTDHDYYVHDGQDQGYLSSSDVYSSTAEGGTAAVPGTDSNDATYVMEDGDTTSQTITEENYNYTPSERITETESSVGDILYDQSSVTVVATNYVTYDEDALRADGTLDDMTFEEFAAQNSDRVKREVDQDFYDMVSKATGIATDNITIVAYDIPFFDYSDSSGRSVTDYLQIALAVLIFAMLGYVVFRSTRKEQDVQLEPELSVEALLETTREAEQEDLEDIGYNEKSETRVLIEKFVDENPEAVAALLRNWLNEEWN